MKKRRSFRRILRRILFVCLLLILLFAMGSNWYVHQPSAWQKEMGRKLPPVLLKLVEGAGNGFAEYTDSLGLTGHDVAIATPAGFHAGIPFFGAPPIACKINAIAAPARLIPLTKTGFSIAYSPADRHPYWVAYMLNPVDSLASPPRPQRFNPDPAVKSPKHDDYTNSGYDRGHMAPNFAMATRYGAAAQQETFLTSNICPQRPSLNQGAWRDVEHRIAAVYAQRYPVWVIIGALPERSAKNRLPSGISIPAGFYHIIIANNGDQLRVCALLFPQNAPRNEHPRKYLTSVRDIERLTGLDFFSDLPADEQDQIEIPVASRLWPAGVSGTWEILKDRTESRAMRYGKSTY